MIYHQVVNQQAESLYQGNNFHYEEYILNLKTKAIYPNVSMAKKLFDFAFSSLLFVLIFSWLFPLIAIAIKLNSRGPVFFIQKRVGLNGDIFRCYKFRTMVTDQGRYMYTPTSVGDRRITKVGAFLRRTNLDELPQFINVLAGDMSIVGPRPHAIAFHKTYASFIDNIDRRQLVKPGITGLAQVNGYRGDVEDFEENKLRTRARIKYDIQYIKSWSFNMDMIIVYKTFTQMLNRDTNGH